MIDPRGMGEPPLIRREKTHGASDLIVSHANHPENVKRDGVVMPAALTKEVGVRTKVLGPKTHAVQVSEAGPVPGWRKKLGCEIDLDLVLVTSLPPTNAVHWDKGEETPGVAGLQPFMSGLGKICV